MDVKRSLFQAIVIHAVACGLLFFLFYERRESGIPRTKEVSVTLAWPGQASSKAGPRTAPSAKEIPKLSDLGISFFGKRTVLPESEGGGGGEGEDEGGGIHDSALYRYVFREINQRLTYPDLFKQSLIDGRVEAKLVFSKDGEFLPDQSKFSAGSGFLRVSVIQNLRATFLSPIPKALRRDRPFSVSCVFIFEVVEHADGETVRTKQVDDGGLLAFYRYYVHSKAQWDLGPFSGIAPIPFVGFSPLWVVDKVAELFSKKAKIDPFDKYRQDPEW